EHGERLADRVVEPLLAQLADEDVVGAAQQVRILLPDLAENAHAEARARERVPVHEARRQTELDADLADLVLEEVAQRLDQLEMHPLRQAADVVVRLDQRGLAGRRARRLDHVRIDRPLREPLDALETLRLGLEDLDEQPADDLALVLRILDAFERREEALLGVDSDHVDAEMLAEHGHDLVALAEPEQAVIDEDADELIADRRVQERRDDGRVDAARQREQHALVPDLVPHPLDVIGDDVPRRPRRRAPADVANEARKDLEAVLRMRDLGVKLQAVDSALRIRDRGERRVTRLRDRLEPGRQPLDPVTVAHPDLERAIRSAEPAEERILVDQHDLGVAVLALVRRSYLAAETRGEGLHAVADAEQRHAGVEHGVRYGRRAGRRGRIRAPGENDAGRVERSDRLVGRIVRVDLAVDARLADSPRDQLRVLRAVVEDQDLAFHRSVTGKMVSDTNFRRRRGKAEKGCQTPFFAATPAADRRPPKNGV